MCRLVSSRKSLINDHIVGTRFRAAKKARTKATNSLHGGYCTCDARGIDDSSIIVAVV